MKKLARITLIGALAIMVMAGAAFAAPQNEQMAEQKNLGTKLGETLGKGYETIRGAIAQLLGIEEEALVAERESGRSLVDIAGDYDVTEDQLVAEALGARTESLEGLVAEGKITEEQAATALDRMSDRIAEKMNRTDVPTPGEGHGEKMQKSEAKSFRNGGNK